jgi:hypothetical protein
MLKGRSDKVTFRKINIWPLRAKLKALGIDK